MQPSLGRAITIDDRPGTAPVVVLSYQFWQDRFASNPSVIGQQLKLNQQSFTIIGVTPATFKARSKWVFIPPSRSPSLSSH